MSVRPSVRMERRNSPSTDYHEILYLLFLLKSIDIFQFLLKQDKNYRHFVWEPKNNYVIGIHNTDSVCCEARIVANKRLTNVNVT